MSETDSLNRLTFCISATLLNENWNLSFYLTLTLRGNIFVWRSENEIGDYVVDA